MTTRTEAEIEDEHLAQVLDECDAKIDALAALMDKLPLAEGRAVTIEEEADNLCSSALSMVLHDLPLARPLGAAGVKRELKEMMQLADKLSDALIGLHRTTLDALKAGHPSCPPLNIRTHLISLSKATDVALKAISTNPPPPVRGPRPKRQAASVTVAAAKSYERLTGKPAGRSVNEEGREGGQFLAFLTAVFDILDIKASPAAQIAAMEKMPPRK